MLQNLRFRFGEIAVWLGLVGKPDVELAVEVQGRCGKKIGELLEEQGHLRSKHTEVILRAQVAENIAPPAPVLREETNTLEDGILFYQPTAEFFNDQPKFRRLCRDPKTVIIVSLQNLNDMNNACAERLWMLLGGNGIVLCEVGGRAIECLRKLGITEVVPVASSNEEALTIARKMHVELTSNIEPVNASSAQVNEQKESQTIKDREQLIVTPEVASSMMIEENEDLIIIHFTGRLLNENGMWDLIDELPEDHCKPVIFDFTAVIQADIDSIGKMICQFTDRSIRVCGSEAILRKIRRVGLVPEDNLFSDLESAIAIPQCKVVSNIERFFGTRSGNVYHRQDCPRYLTSLEANRIELDEAEINKRRACGVCIPLTTARNSN